MEVFVTLLSDAVMDTLKLTPFLFLTYLAMEYLETKAGEKTIAFLMNTGKRGPILGGLLGVIPQCGFSAAAANFYSGGVITVGTMIAVFLSTSDEMLPILLSTQASPLLILKILAGKILVGVTAGIVVDLSVRILNHGKQRGLHIREICEREHCHQEEGNIFYSALLHSLQIVGFIFTITLLINWMVEWIGMEQLVRTVSSYPLLSILISALVGLIPNCAASVTITSLYVEGILTAGSMFAGLLSCAGIGILVLFRSNRHLKRNLQILGILYGVSVICGLLLDILPVL